MADRAKGLQNMIPYIAYESELARLERIVRKMFVIIIVLIAMLVGTNACWIWYENQFIDEVTVTQENDDGYNNYVDGDGTINN